jgi:hypothetical protein
MKSNDDTNAVYTRPRGLSAGIAAELAGLICDCLDCYSPERGLSGLAHQIEIFGELQQARKSVSLLLQVRMRSNLARKQFKSRGLLISRHSADSFVRTLRPSHQSSSISSGWWIRSAIWLQCHCSPWSMRAASRIEND